MLITLVENRRSSMNFHGTSRRQMRRYCHCHVTASLCAHFISHFLYYQILCHFMSFPLKIDIYIYIRIYFIYIYIYIYIYIGYNIGYKGAAAWSQALASNRIALSISPLASNFCRCSWQPMPPVAAKAAM